MPIESRSTNLQIIVAEFPCPRRGRGRGSMSCIVSSLRTLIAVSCRSNIHARDDREAEVANSASSILGPGKEDWLLLTFALIQGPPFSK